MKVELPITRPYGALFVVGTRLAANGTAETIGSIIVKAGYRLTAGSGGDTHAMTTDPDPAASAIVTADQGALFQNSADGMDVTREADIAPFKPLADIVVEGFLADDPDNADAELRVNGAGWLTRAAELADLSAASRADRDLHLFGYQPRTENPRRADAFADAGDRPRSLPEFDHYSNRFLNFHRRGGGFSASASVSAALTNGQHITVRKVGAEAFSITLAIPRLTALYRTWCGHGPDKAPYWTRIHLGDMRADTLILRPDSSSAEVIWRATWIWAAQPADRYRAVRVSEGGA
jgi:hypothetical protein